MKSDLPKRLHVITKVSDGLAVLFHQEDNSTLALLKECSEAIEELTNIFPKKCRFCIGCELEEDPNNGCPEFILSPSRAKRVVEDIS